VKSRLLLDVIVRQSTPIFQLLSGEDKSLLIGGNTFLVLDLRLHVVNGVGTLHLQRYRFARQGLHKDLHLDGKKDPKKRRKPCQISQTQPKTTEKRKKKIANFTKNTQKTLYNLQIVHNQSVSWIQAQRNKSNDCSRTRAGRERKGRKYESEGVKKGIFIRTKGVNSEGQ
jgi:hypothetical protein